MTLIYCSECGKKISDTADKCVHCGAPIKLEDLKKDSKNNSVETVFKVLGVIIIFIIIFALLGAWSNSSNYSTTSTPYKSNSYGDISKENYDLIKVGMTKEQVFNILGSSATISEVEMSGLGKMELYYYQKALSTKAIMIYFVNGFVESKNWVEL